MKKNLCVIMAALAVITGVRAQNNVFNTTGNASLNNINYLQGGSSLFFQAPMNTANNWTRGILSQGVVWNGSSWVMQGTSADLSMLRLENSGVMSFFTGVGITVGSSLTDAQLASYCRMIIANNGNVGIGTLSPAQKLHLMGTGGIRLQGTGSGTDVIDMVPGTAVGFDRLDFKSVNTNRGISFQLTPNGSSTASKLALTNQADQANFSSVYLLAENTGAWISPQNLGTPSSAITSLSLGGGNGGGNWTNVVIPGGNVGIGESTPVNKLDIKLASNNQYLSTVTTETVPVNALGSGLRLGWGNKIAGPTMRLVHGGDWNNAGVAFSTWSGAAEVERMRIAANGNVGIGTVSPVSKLQLGEFATSSSNALVIPGTYNFEQVKLGQYGNGNAGLELINHSGTSNSYGIKFLTNVDQVPGLQIQYAPATSAYSTLSYTTGLFIGLDGNVAIGTTSNTAGYKLAVKGTIGAQKVTVTSQGWADYVFDKNYQLAPLSEVENFITQNKHLPEVPSASEVAVNGVDLGDNQVILLKKVEELTLYAIDQEKKLSEKDKKIQVLTDQLQAVLTRLEKLEKSKR